MGLLQNFQALLEEAKWYTLFDQINLSGKDVGIETVAEKMTDLSH